MSVHGPLVLASQSPQRREIMRGLGLTFEVRPADIDETPGAAEAPQAYARRMALEKALRVGCRAESTAMGAWTTVGADTIVVCEGVLMGKPLDDADALRMLSLLAGRWHRVTTAVCVVSASCAPCSREVLTEVRFRDLPDAVLRRYVATGEGRDKAGSYAIQGLGRGLVAEVRGSYSNVVGLPAAETLEMLEAAGCVEAWP